MALMLTRIRIPSRRRGRRFPKAPPACKATGTLPLLLVKCDRDNGPPGRGTSAVGLAAWYAARGLGAVRPAEPEPDSGSAPTSGLSGSEAEPAARRTATSKGGRVRARPGAVWQWPGNTQGHVANVLYRNFRDLHRGRDHALPISVRAVIHFSSPIAWHHRGPVARRITTAPRHRCAATAPCAMACRGALDHSASAASGNTVGRARYPSEAEACGWLLAPALGQLRGRLRSHCGFSAELRTQEGCQMLYTTDESKTCLGHNRRIGAFGTLLTLDARSARLMRMICCIGALGWQRRAMRGTRRLLARRLLARRLFLG